MPTNCTDPSHEWLTAEAARQAIILSTMGLQPIIDWLSTHRTLMWWSGGLSIVTFVGTLIAVPVLLVKMPPDYFVRETLKPPGEHWFPWLLRKVLKNFAGLILLMMGIAMLVLPGQGVLTILIGLTLLDFPGKRSFELMLVRQRPVLRSINWIRRRRGRQPVQVEAPPDSDEREPGSPTGQQTTAE
ncbi:MAG: PGPGW domain-containing protein [Planctomycetaceae bacterium]